MSGRRGYTRPAHSTVVSDRAACREARDNCVCVAASLVPWAGDQLWPRLRRGQQPTSDHLFSSPWTLSSSSSEKN